MWEIFYGMEPYPGMNLMKVADRVITKGYRPNTDGPPSGITYTEMPDAYEALMTKCWDKDPLERLPFTEVINELQKIEEDGFKVRKP